jgi:tetratricopeptide (TPR) repeat protein
MLTAMPGSKHRGRRAGVQIREGSVLQARKEAGLSLAEVAGNEVSRTAIHLIEHGRIKPSLETLQQISQKTRKPMEYFLVSDEAGEARPTPPQLLELERLTFTRDFDAVINLGLPLVGRAWKKAERALLHFYLGQAFCRMVRPAEALEYLPIARRDFEQLQDEWMAVEALDWESSALGLLEAAEAIPLATEALERCRRLDPKPPQTEARILGHIANMYVVSRSWAQALRFYQAAVEAAGGVKDLLQQAKMHHGLGGAYRRIGQPAKARQHFDRALALYSIESDLSAVYRVENDLGDLLLHEGQLDSAEEHLMKALAGSDELHIDRRGRGFILGCLAELFLKRDDLQQARSYALQALTSGDTTGEHIVQAEAHSLLGRIEEKTGDAAAADRAFARAFAVLDKLEMPDRSRDYHMEYAEMLEARGDIKSAARHWRLAAEIGKLTSMGIKAGDAETQPSAAMGNGSSGPAA